MLFSFRFKVICFIIGLWDFFSFYYFSSRFLSVWMAQWREVLTVFPAGRKSRGWHEGGIPEDLNPAPHAWINHPFVKSQQRRIAYLIWTRGMGFFVCVCALRDTNLVGLLENSQTFDCLVNCVWQLIRFVELHLCCVYTGHSASILDSYHALFHVFNFRIWIEY